MKSATIHKTETDQSLWGLVEPILRRIRKPKRLTFWTAVLLVCAGIGSSVATYFALTGVPPLGNNPNTVIWLLNINLIILLLLVMVIARRIVKIVSGHRQGLAGSRLHVRLTLIFSFLAAAPAILMAIFSAFFFHFGIQTWFSERVQTAIQESQAVAEAYLDEHQDSIRADTLAAALDLDRQFHLLTSREGALKRMLNEQSFARNLPEAIIFDRGGRVIAQSDFSFTIAFEALPTYVLDEADKGEVVIMTGDNDDRVRALVKLNNYTDSYLFVGRMIDPKVLGHMNTTRLAARDYATLQGEYSGLQVKVTLIFVMFALLLLFTAIWFGIVLARQLVLPIGTLVSVSERVRGGDLTAHVPEQSDIEEFDYLAKSFNRMTAQISEQRDELIEANRKMDQRRKFTETILAGVSAGVISISENGDINLVNASAAELFDQDIDDIQGRNILDMLPTLEPLLVEAHDNPKKITQSEIPYHGVSGIRVLHVRIAIELIGDEDKGAILTFDDITDLQAAQRKAAWSGVARRIAHEIKNPLTPIQLSAERLKRKYLKEIQTDPEVFERCTDTIIKHVGDIGHMVREFSDFARMPEPVMKPVNIVSLMTDVIILQREAHNSITFDVVFDGDRALYQNIPCDAQQIRQALTNLIQNAVESVSMKLVQSGEKKKIFEGKIQIALTQDGAQKDPMMVLSIADNGMGFPEGQDPANLTEPYVTHREKGTGLGLAIVKKIMEDHGGKIVLEKNPENGATVKLIMPMSSTQTQVADEQEAA